MFNVLVTLACGDLWSVVYHMVTFMTGRVLIMLKKGWYRGIHIIISSSRQWESWRSSKVWVEWHLLSPVDKRSDLLYSLIFFFKDKDKKLAG